MAIGLSIAHKIGDASTLCTLLSHWSTLCSASGHELMMLPKFKVASLFPPFHLLSSQPHVVEFVKDKCSTRRLVFDASKIATLQSRTASTTVPNLTRVEAVSSLIWKCAMEASRSNSGSLRQSVFCQAVDMRKRLVPCMPDQNIARNLVAFFAAKTEEFQIDLQGLVVKLRRGIEEVSENYKKGFDGNEIQKALVEFGEFIKNEDIDTYNCTSLCSFPMYKANFGWGKPSWVSTSSVTFKNVMLFMDTKTGDGIEAWLTFKNEDMILFERNKELRDFALLNPSVI